MGQCEDQLQREALLELAILFVVIDGEIAEDEQNFLEKWLETLEWKSDTSLSEYQKLATQKCIDAVQQDDVDHFIAQQARLLVDQTMKDQAMKMADEIANVDGVLDDNEVKALEILRSYLA